MYGPASRPILEECLTFRERLIDDQPGIVCGSLDCVRFKLCAHRAISYKKRREIGEAHRYQWRYDAAVLNFCDAIGTNWGAMRWP
jgi:hypothetical protein